MASLHDVRRDYTGEPLPDDPSTIDPWNLFAAWIHDALAAGEVEPTAMTLATVDALGRPASRIVLLKEYSPRGLVFFTGYGSAKGRDLEAHPVAAASFWWPSRMRQVRAVGDVTRLPREETEAYFATRPRPSQLEAWASRQSAPLADRADLRRALHLEEERWAGGEVPCPPEWGGFVIDVDSFEFWQGLPGRLHDRVVFRRDVGSWLAERLQP
ncbi:MAG: pyridoxamine 5'-phosphate oxidase [Arachnia sp.]